MMNTLHRLFSIALLAYVVGGCLSAHAHLMPERRGTLNIVHDGAYMVLSLPVSAFDHVDVNKDGKTTMIEFNTHRSQIIEQVRRGVELVVDETHQQLHGILLSPVPVESDKAAASAEFSRVYVMGKFTLDQSHGTLQFYNGLYGKEIGHQSIEMTATRQSDKQKQVFELSPQTKGVFLFSENTKPQSQ